MPLFPRFHQVIRVVQPFWQNGQWVQPPEPEAVNHALNVQPKDDRLVAFGPVDFPLKLDDVLIYDGAAWGNITNRWICVNVRKRDMLGPDTAHVRYEFRPEQLPGG